MEFYRIPVSGIFSGVHLTNKLSRTIECFKIWRWLLNIVPAEIAVNVLIGCLYIHVGMRDYI